MDEVQSWWEVPAVAHFCYVFRAPFNLFFFEIAELESALLNIQDPDMSISLEQLVTRLLQGCYDDESVNEDNWEEKLQDLFNDNFEDQENPLGNSYFPHLSPRSKIEILLKLCELRLDVDGVLDDIKDIPSEDMQAKCIGKDSQNNTYWYFCNERLYKEAGSSEKKLPQPVKNKNLKNNSNKISRQNTREKRLKTSPDINKSWSIACFTINDWEQLSNSFSKSKKSIEKELSTALKEHIPILQEKVAEKDRLLRKRFLELAPKRASSRLSRVQEMKKLEELKAAEEAKKAALKAEKERARKEALLLKKMKESRQKRAEERSKAIEERAERAKLRQLMRNEDTDSSEEEDDDKSHAKRVLPVKSKKRRDSSCQGTKRKVKEESINGRSGESYCNSNSRTGKKTKISKSDYSNSHPNSRQPVNSYSKTNKQSVDFYKSSKAFKNNPLKSSITFKTNADISLNIENPKIPCTSHNTKKVGCSDELKNEESCNKNATIMTYSKNSNPTKSEDLLPKQKPSNLCTYSYRNSLVNNIVTPPQIPVYKSNVLSNASDLSKWNAAFGSKGQKVHILYKSSDNLGSKRIKIEPVNFRTVPTSMKSSLTKENRVYKPVQFITYGKIIPSSTVVKFEYKESSNQPVSS